VGAVAALDRPPRDLGRVCRVQYGFDASIRTRLELEVEPLVEVGSGYREHVFQEFRRALSGCGDGVEQKQAGEDAVSLRQMPAEAVPSAFLAADERVTFHHQRADVLKADWRLDALDAVVRGEDRGHVCCRDR